MAGDRKSPIGRKDRKANPRRNVWPDLARRTPSPISPAPDPAIAPDSDGPGVDRDPPPSTPPTFAGDEYGRAWHDWLRDLIYSGAVAAYLGADGAARASRSVAALDFEHTEAAREIVLAVMQAEWAARYRAVRLVPQACGPVSLDDLLGATSQGAAH
jgi:hypothetical protein